MMCLDSKNSRPLAAVLGMLLMMLGSGTALAETRIESGTDKEARLPFWQISDAGMSLRLVQRLPDQTRGYFQARGHRQQLCLPDGIQESLQQKSARCTGIQPARLGRDRQWKKTGTQIT